MYLIKYNLLKENIIIIQKIKREPLYISTASALTSTFSLSINFRYFSSIAHIRCVPLAPTKKKTKETTKRKTKLVAQKLGQ